MKKSNSPPPPWQDLDPFILSQIFSHFNLRDHLFGPPNVCRSWLSASLHTLFKHPTLDLSPLQSLDLQHDDDDQHQLHQKQQLLRYTHLLKLAIKRCHGWVSLSLPQKNMSNYSTIMHIAENIPKIMTLLLPFDTDASENLYPIFTSLMYMENLRAFHGPIPQGIAFQVVQQLVDYCKNIVELGVHGVFTEKEVACVVEGFPGLKVLDFSESTLPASALRMLLDGRLGCIKELNLKRCLFVDEEGKDMRQDYVKWKRFRIEILDKASRVKSLKKFTHCLGEDICNQCGTRSVSVGDK